MERPSRSSGIVAANLGFPRIGRDRELKTALERYWAGAISEAALREVAGAVRRQNWTVQVEAGIDHAPSCGRAAPTFR